MVKFDSELFWLTACLYHEARGEDLDGMKAVCHVILNRARNRKRSIKETVLAPWQFSWANNGDRPAIRDYDSFATCLTVAQISMDERAAGNSMLGADHYYSHKGPNAIPAPSWVQKGKMKEVARIGNHIFFRS